MPSNIGFGDSFDCIAPQQVDSLPSLYKHSFLTHLFLCGAYFTACSHSLLFSRPLSILLVIMCCIGSEEDLHSGMKTFNRHGRSCTDILFLILFLAGFAFSIFIVISAAKSNGNAYAATHGRNFDGASCGLGEFKDKKFSAWPIPPLISASTTPEQAKEYYKIKVCVKSCGETNDPASDKFLNPYASQELWRFCIPQSIIDAAAEGAGQLPEISSHSDTLSRYISDLIICWRIILVAVLVAVFVGFTYTKLMSFKCIRTVMVWSVILAILAMSALLTAFLFHWSSHAQNIPLDSIDRQRAVKIGAWIMVAITAIIFLTIIILRKRINFTLSVIGSTSCALSQMKSLFLYPIVPTIFALGYLVYAVIAFGTILTVNKSTSIDLPDAILEIPYFKTLDHKSYAELTFDSKFGWALGFQIWHFLWVNQFFVYATYMTIAGALGHWYFSEPKPGNDREKQIGGPNGLSHTPVMHSAFRTAFYHVGTIAFAAMIISVFQFIRVIITYLQTKLKGKRNRFARCVLGCVKCCLYCVQKCIDYVSRNALIVTAIKGTNFCSSGCTAFGLLSSNMLRAAAFNVLSGFVLWIGKLFISLLTTGGAALFIQVYFVDDRADDISSPVLPLIVIFILSWSIASMFMHVYAVSLDCMFICYLADKDGYYTPAKIKKTFEKVEQREKLLTDEQSSDDYDESDYSANGGYGSYKNPHQPTYYATTQQPKDLSNPYA